MLYARDTLSLEDMKAALHSKELCKLVSEKDNGQQGLVVKKSNKDVILTRTREREIDPVSDKNIGEQAEDLFVKESSKNVILIRNREREIGPKAESGSKPYIKYCIVTNCKPYGFPRLRIRRKMRNQKKYSLI